MTQNITASRIYKEYQITAPAAGASTAQALAFEDTTNGRRRVVVEAIGAANDRIFFKFGTGAVAASKTVASNALTDGNFSLPVGAIREVDLPASVTHVSTISLTADSTAIVQLCDAKRN